jgi:hypothetical protein
VSWFTHYGAGFDLFSFPPSALNYSTSSASDVRSKF